jgi:L-iditol 2-dehydrogenase
LPKDNSSISFDSNIVHYKELLVTATTACSTDNCWQAAQIINSGRVDLSDLVSKRFPLKEAKEAFAEALQKKALKIVIEP